MSSPKPASYYTEQGFKFEALMEQAREASFYKKEMKRIDAHIKECKDCAKIWPTGIEWDDFTIKEEWWKQCDECDHVFKWSSVKEDDYDNVVCQGCDD